MAQGILGLPPGMRAWMLAEQHADARNANQLQQVGGILALQDQMQKAAMEQRLAPVRERLLAAQAADVEAKPLDRTLTRQAQQEATLSRLSQAAAQFEANWQLKYRNAGTQEERLELDRQKEQFKQSLQTEAQRMAGAQAGYNFGFVPGTVGPTVAPTAPAAGGYAPTPTAPAAPGILQQQPHMRISALEQAQRDADAELIKRRETLPEGGGAIPSSAVLGPLAQAAPPVTAPTGPVSEFGNVIGGGSSDVGPGVRVAGAYMPPTVGAAATAPAPAPAAPVAPAKPIMPTFTGSPREQAVAQNKWLLQQSKPSISGGGELTPEALNFTAKQYLSGDRQAVQGFARSTTARVALQNAIVDEAARQGLTPEQTAAKIAEFAGTVAGSRTTGQRAANIALAATEAEEMIGVVKASSDKFGRTNFVPWNAALRAYESGTGSPEIAAFGASVNALVNVYARAINPTGVPTVSDKEHARAVLNTIQSPQQVDAVLAIIKQELEIAKKAPATVREAIRTGITGEAPPTRPNIRSSDQDLVNKYLKK